MAAQAASTKWSLRHWLIVVLLATVPFAACLATALWAEFAPHYILLDKIDLFDASEWSSNTQVLITSNGNRFSIWSGETRVCASKPALCQGSTKAEVMKKLTSWFTQQGWTTVQRDPAGWNMCDNSSLANQQVDLVLEQRGGMYYKPAACITIETDSTTSGFEVYATTINPSPLTSWSD